MGDFKSIFSTGNGDLSILHSVISPKQEGEKWIGIAPFAAHKGKIYPVKLMEQVINKLISDHDNIRIFLFGRGSKESDIFSIWCKKYKQCIFVSDSIEQIYEELILMSHLNVMISMDSANMHLASLVNVPVVSVWGSTHPYSGFMGWNQSESNAVQIDLPCRPCSIYGNKPCLRGDYACLNNIPPEQITERVNIVLAKNK